jgi:DNA polymerase
MGGKEERLKRLYDGSAEARRCGELEIAEGATFVSDLGHGDPDADLFLIGEAPGAEEDRTGVPFVGPAGEMLSESLAGISLSRFEVWVGNVVRYRPTAAGADRNRKPRSAEVRACLPLLLRELEIVDPQVVATLGLTALRALTGYRGAMRDAAGEPREWEGRALYPLYHPAAAIYDRSLGARIRRDFRGLRELLDGQ